MRRIVTLALMVLMVGGYEVVQAQPPTSTGTSTSTGNQNQRNPQAPTETEMATKEFLGLKWGLGIGVMGAFGGDTAVEKASLTGTEKLVRVDEEGDFRPQAFMEMHMFVGRKARCWRKYQQKMSAWRDDSQSFQSTMVKKTNSGDVLLDCPEWWPNTDPQVSSGRQEPMMPDPPLRGFGPFVALQGSENKVINAFTVGAMMGFRKDATATSSVNIGIGLSFDPSVQVLGHGIKEGRKLPNGETEVRFKKEGRFGWVIMTSFTF